MADDRSIHCRVVAVHQAENTLRSCLDGNLAGVMTFAGLNADVPPYHALHCIAAELGYANAVFRPCPHSRKRAARAARA